MSDLPAVSCQNCGPDVLNIKEGEPRLERRGSFFCCEECLVEYCAPDYIVLLRNAQTTAERLVWLQGDIQTGRISANEISRRLDFIIDGINLHGLEEYI